MLTATGYGYGVYGVCGAFVSSCQGRVGQPVQDIQHKVCGNNSGGV